MTSPHPGRMCRLLLTMAITAMACVLAAGPAHAGGPTSALLVSPSTNRAAALYYSDAAYEQLDSLVGGYSPTPDPAAVASSAGAQYVTVTWLIHDVSVWRIDRIFIDGEGQQWIATLQVDGSGSMGGGMDPGETGDGREILHRSGDPVALTALLTSLGLLGGQPGDEPAAADPALLEVPAAESAGAVPPVEMTDRSASWWWGLVGVAVGIVLAAAVLRFLPAVRRRLLGRTSADDGSDADGAPIRMTTLAG